MENLDLAKRVLRRIETEPRSFSMVSWGVRNACGITACLGGWTMLEEGYTVVDYGQFARPDGTVVEDNSHETFKLLGLTWAEYNRDPFGLFFIPEESEAIRIFRVLIEEEEEARRAAQ